MFSWLCKLVPITEVVAVAVNLRASKFIVESYCKGAINLINSSDVCLNEFGSILAYIASFSSDSEVVFNFVSGDCNKVDHGLAHHSFVFTVTES